jgi:predicted N-formylglutamate amidohydrolase
LDQGSKARGELLAYDEPAPYERVDFGVGRSVVVVCDHARNRVPQSLGTLGLAPRHFYDHIAWDIGAEGVARGLAEKLRAPLIVGVYSRLVLDLNRSERDASAIPAISDGVLVPGNIALSQAARRQRFRAIHDVYHTAVDELLAENTTGSLCPTLIAIHSFTPQVSGIYRPWHAGVLWDKDPRVALPLLAALRAAGDIVVGDNEPYSGRHTADYTVDLHAELAGYAYGAIEIRQDQIQSVEGQQAWANRLFDALVPILDDEKIYSRRDGWSLEA